MESGPGCYEGSWYTDTPSTYWDAHLSPSHGERGKKQGHLSLLQDEPKAQDSRRQQGCVMMTRKWEKKISAGHAPRTQKLAP